MLMDKSEPLFHFVSALLSYGPLTLLMILATYGISPQNGLFVIKVVVLVLLVIAAVQDYKTREVSNWITIPLFLLGLFALMFLHSVLPIIAMTLLFVSWVKGWLGAADAKVLIGLFGVWSLSAIVSMLLLGIYGAYLLGRQDEKSFPGLVTIAIGAGLTFAGEVSIILLN